MSNHSFNEEIKQAMSNSWTVPYKNYVITVKNEIYCEQLYINNELVLEHRHTSFLTTLNPIQKLSYTYIQENGQQDKIVVTLGGIIAINIKIKVNNECILKDKISLFK